MSKNILIFSTLSNDNRYVNHEHGGADLMTPAGDGVLIQGGANVMNRREDIAPGVVTKIDADELEYLQANELFRLHVKNGFLMVSDHAVDVEVAAADMEGREPSAPLVAEDLAPTDPQPAAASVKTSSRRA